MNVQAIVLAGGLGTRLRSVIHDLPKPLAPIVGKPFLAYLLRSLRQGGITDVVLSVGYKRDAVMAAFGAGFEGMRVRYAAEEQPLGTGGAITNALHLIESDDVFVLNGDTMFRLDYADMFARYRASRASMALALRWVEDSGRYGRVVEQDGRVAAFEERGAAGPGLVNAGVYLLARRLLAEHALPRKFSFEQDFLTPNVKKLAPLAYVSDGYFIDIGIPEDYARAQHELPLLGL